MMYALGRDVKRDPQKAASWFLRLAEQGNTDAMFMLASLHDEEFKNPSLAAEWYQRAAEKGHAPARYNLAILFLSGDETMRNLQLARKWFEACAASSRDPSLVEKAKLRLVDMSEKNPN
jgi:TPR repeat protein